MLGQLIGKGNTAEIYEYGSDKICKLFVKEYPYAYVALEHRNSNEVLSRGICAPQVFDIVTVKDRYGILFERIYGRSMLECMMEDANAMLEIFVNLHKEFISCTAQNLLSYKRFLSAMVKTKGKEDDEQSLLEAIEKLPDGDFLLHGDLHPDNILIKEDGTPVVIDFMNVCRGPQMFDIARSFFLLKRKSEILGKRYLDAMNANEKDISQYLDVIEQCRKYERR